MHFNSNPTVNKIRYYSVFLMVAIYIALGLLFLFTDIAVDKFPAYRKEIGAVMLVYAAIRTFSTVRRIKLEGNDRN
ncbi:MAG TPA: hypothetical protein PLL00_03220 [Bacteroidia bacterium]|nr:hypothetical protein [Bacteroidia bacterium]